MVQENSHSEGIGHFCVMCGKAMQVPEDSGVLCVKCERLPYWRVRYCAGCGVSEVVMGTVFCSHYSRLAGVYRPALD